MAQRQKLQGKAIARILDAKSREVVGYLYKWNTGSISSMWNDNIERDDVVYGYS